MTTLAEIILVPAERTRNYAAKVVEGIDAATAARLPQGPAGSGGRIQTNHPVWVFGHLALYAPFAMKLAGLDASPLSCPEDWEPLFKNGSACVDDAEGRVYPSLNEVFERFTRATDGAIAALRGLPEAAFLRPNTDERSSAMFPTVGAGAVFLLNNHPMIHLGQVSAWRRCWGLPSAL